MSYERTEAKLRALVAQREAERHRDCPTPGCRLAEGHDGLHRMVPEVERLRARVAELEAEVRASRASPDEASEEVNRLRRELDWYRAAHVLIANSDVFINAKGDGVFFTDAVFKDGKPGLSLNLNDVFFWGCADAEDIDYVDAPALLEIAKRDGSDGLIAYARDKRMARGEKWDEKHLATYTPGLVTLDRLRAAESALAATLERARALEEALRELESTATELSVVASQVYVLRSDGTLQMIKLPALAANVSRAAMRARALLPAASATGADSGGRET